jgi:hypothetical protein
VQLPGGKTVTLPLPTTRPPAPVPPAPPKK